MNVFVLKLIATVLFLLHLVASQNSTATSNVSKSVEYDDYGDADLDYAKTMENVPFRPPQDPAEFMDYMEEIITNTRTKITEVMEMYLPRLLRMSSSVTLSSRCTYDLFRFLLGIRDLKPWAIKLLDASGKLPDGILYGTFTALGAYDECLNIELKDEKANGTDDASMGQYCRVNIAPLLPPKPPTSSLERAFSEAADARGYPKEDHFSRLAPFFYFLKFRLGVCLPSSCTLKDIKAVTASISQNVKVNVTIEGCEVKEPFRISKEQLISGCVLGIVVGLVLLGTIVDIVYKTFNYDSTSFLTKSCLSFSAYTNSVYLLSSDAPDDSIKPLYGLKVLSLIWIILAHSYATLDLKVVGHLLRTRRVHSSLLFQAVINASLAIETFFFISGLLVAYLTLRKLKSGSKLTLKDWLWLYMHRIIRLTPALMLVIAIVLFASPFLDGPLWKEIIFPSADRCKRNWWIHALHISNFFDVSKMCFIHLWYVAADIQLFLLSPLVLVALYKKPHFGKVVAAVIILASIVSTGVITYLEDIPPTLLFTSPDPLSRKPFGNKILVKPYPHITSYIIGILVGYLLEGSSQIKLRKKNALLGWLLALTVCGFSVFITYHWNNGHLPSPTFAALYAGSYRTLWSLAVAWITISCHLGKGGVIGKVLSWSFFVPLSKLTYVAYLIHPGLMFMFVASARNLFTFSHFLVIHLFFSYLVTTFLASYLLSLFIEVPFVALDKTIEAHYRRRAPYGKKCFYPVSQIKLSDISLNFGKSGNHFYPHGVFYPTEADLSKLSGDFNDTSDQIYKCKL